MPTYPFFQVDAFTDKPLGGNPCAVVFDADDLDSQTMQRIAREMNLSETAFVLHSERADVRARYFTPAEEIPLAGHPTIATVHALVESGRISFSGEQKTIALELNIGPIAVEISGEFARPQITMSQKKPEFFRVYSPDQVLPVFGLTPDNLLTGANIQTVSTGTPQLMVPVKNIDTLKHIRLNTAAYIQLREQGDFFSTHVFTLKGVETGDTFARHFVTPPDLIEDPFTGSATGGMAAYLWHHHLINKPTFLAEQGHWMDRPGIANVEVIGAPDAIETVKVGGTAVTVLRGELVL